MLAEWEERDAGGARLCGGRLVALEARYVATQSREDDSLREPEGGGNGLANDARAGVALVLINALGERS